jgi:pimeloyl-ACP methyl ester carboxylesterase
LTIRLLRVWGFAFGAAYSDRAVGSRQCDHFSDAALIEVDGVGHFVPLEAPEAVVSAIGAAITGGPVA